MPTTIDSAGITFNDASTITSANTFIAKPASPSNGQVLGYNGSTWTGTSLSASPMVAKAWVNFNGTFATSPFTIANGGIRSTYNVSSVTDNGGSGNYTINFVANLFSDSNYVLVGTSGSTSQGVALHINTKTNTNCSIFLQNTDSSPSKVDNSIVDVLIFGN